MDALACSCHAWSFPGVWRVCGLYNSSKGATECGSLSSGTMSCFSASPLLWLHRYRSWLAMGWSLAQACSKNCSKGLKRKDDLLQSALCCSVAHSIPCLDFHLLSTMMIVVCSLPLLCVSSLPHLNWICCFLGSFLAREPSLAASSVHHYNSWTASYINFVDQKSSDFVI